MPNYIGTPPDEYVIPVTMGADRAFTLNRQDKAGNPLDWDALVSITIDIDKLAPTVVPATVAGPQANIVIPHTVADQVTNKTRWRVTMTDNATSLETPICVGTFERHDG